MSPVETDISCTRKFWLALDLIFAHSDTNVSPSWPHLIIWLYGRLSVDVPVGTAVPGGSRAIRKFGPMDVVELR